MPLQVGVLVELGKLQQFFYPVSFSVEEGGMEKAFDPPGEKPLSPVQENSSRAEEAHRGARQAGEEAEEEQGGR